MKAAHTIIAALVLTLLAGDARAQHEGHQVPAAPGPAARNPDCAQAGSKALAIVGAAGLRLDTAGRATSNAELQLAAAQAQLAVAAAQAELFTCRAAVPTPSADTPPPAAMAGMDHSKMNMGTPAPGARTAASGAKPPDPMAGMDHSKMNMGTPAAGAKTAAPGAKPADPMAGMDHSKMNMGKAAPGGQPAASKTKPDGAMAGMDHSKMAMGGAAAKPGEVPLAVGSEAKLPVMMAERIADPSCSGNVGQATAPKAVFERQVYYFCSTSARDEFRKDPAAYLKKHPR